jgi:hypothetical protein
VTGGSTVASPGVLTGLTCATGDVLADAVAFADADADAAAATLTGAGLAMAGLAVLLYPVLVVPAAPGTSRPGSLPVSPPVPARSTRRRPLQVAVMLPG